MMNFRDKQPIRTCVKKYANYKSYKPYLAKDFFIDVDIQIALIFGLEE